MRDGTGVYARSLREIGNPAALRSVTIFFRGQYRLGDDDLRALTHARQLEMFTLPGFWCGGPAQITDAGLELIASLPRLRSLSICSDRISDAGLAHLALLSNLRTLELRSSSITDAGIAQLRFLPRLRSLSLRVPNMTDAGLVQLDTFERLVHLDLCGTAVTGAGFSAGRWPFLSTLQGNFTDEGLAWISRPDILRFSLMSLSVVGRGASDTGLGTLAGIPSLWRLSLQDTLVTEQSVRDLQQKKPRLRNVTVINGGRRPLVGAPEHNRSTARALTARHQHARHARQNHR